MTLNATTCPPPVDPYDAIAAQLAEHGWCVTPDFIDPALTARLAAEAELRWSEGDFRQAGVGRAAERAINPGIRSDRIWWLDPAVPTPGQHLYLGQLEQLRLAINRRLFLGLFDFEGHLAVYPPGSFYQRHVDRFRDTSLRTVTCVLYLNDDWQEAEGGQLRLYTDPGRPDDHVDILPLGGRLVTFLSADFPHEVLPASRDRLSLTGWFRSRA